MKLVKKEVWVEPRKRINDRRWSQIDYEVWAQVEYHVWVHVSAQIDNNVWWRIWDHVGKGK